MLDGLERPERSADHLDAHACQCARRDRGQRVLQVVLAADRQVCLGDILSPIADPALGSAGINALGTADSESNHRAAGRRFHGATVRIGRVEHCGVPGMLVAQYACLGRGVVGEVAVPVQVIRRHVQHGGDVTPERRGRLELETGQFEHVPVLGTGTVRYLEHRGTDVAGQPARYARSAQHVIDQRNGRGFAIGAGYADHAPAQHAGCELELATHRDSPLAGGHQTGQVPRHSRRGHDQILLGQQGIGVPAEVQAHRQVLE